VEHEIRPEPSPGEREALTTALAASDLEHPPAYESEWRRLGIDSVATADPWVTPRITRGASRA
jgi:hypothetical protein